MRNEKYAIWARVYSDKQTYFEVLIFLWKANLVVSVELSKESKADIAVLGNQLTATGNHMPCGITQYCLPPGIGDFPAYTPAEAGIRFTDSGRMQDWVYLGDGYIPR